MAPSVAPVSPGLVSQVDLYVVPAQAVLPPRIRSGEGRILGQPREQDLTSPSSVTVAGLSEGSVLARCGVRPGEVVAALPIAGLCPRRRGAFSDRQVAHTTPDDHCEREMMRCQGTSPTRSEGRGRSETMWRNQPAPIRHWTARIMRMDVPLLPAWGNPGAVAGWPVVRVVGDAWCGCCGCGSWLGWSGG